MVQLSVLSISDITIRLLVNMNLEELLQRFRFETRDIVGDPNDTLFSNELITQWLNEAQNKFCERTGWIRDYTTDDICLIPLEAGVETYNLHSAIISVLSAIIEGNNYSLRSISMDVIDWNTQRFPTRFPHEIIQEVGEPIYFLTDQSTGEIKVFPTPDAEYNLRLRVMRRPYKMLNTDYDHKSPEIPEQYHFCLVDYACWRAFSSAEIDGFNWDFARGYETKFQTTIREAQREFRRLMNDPVKIVPGSQGAW